MSESRWRRWTRVFHRDPEAEVEDELAFHLEQRVRDCMERGLDEDAARRAAHQRLGDLAAVRAECAGLLAAERRARDRRLRLNVSWLDVKLGVRMAAKHPGLSVVSVIGMSVAIAIGAGAFGFMQAMLDPSLPFPEGDRIVAIQNNQADNPGNPDRRALHDLGVWREELKTIRDIGAFRTVRSNIVGADGSVDLVPVAEMSAAGFRVTRVAPVLGRTLIEADEEAAAPPVVVIGHSVWQRRFAGDPAIVGHMMRLGSTVHTVVGVMPEEFRFPVNHRFWVPLRLDAATYGPGEGPAIELFGRLADGATMERAQREVAAIGQRMAAAYPDTHARLRPSVMHYTQPFFDVDSPGTVWAIRLFQLVVSLLLVVVAVNVAILVYARTATRSDEIAVRSALGASRRRIVAQLFVEALVLSMAATAIGLALAGTGLWTVQDFWRTSSFADEIPFWLDIGLSLDVVAYATALALVAGVIVGVVPALKATGKKVHEELQRLSTRGSRMQLGRTWTALIIVQVAIAVAVLPYAGYVAGQALLRGMARSEYPAHEILQARLSIEQDDPAAAPADEARFIELSGTLLQRLETEPGLSGVTFASHFPEREPYGRVEVEAMESAVTTSDGASHSVRTNRVAVDMLPLFEVEPIAGRAFGQADAAPGATAVLINPAFAQRLDASGAVLGRRIRYVWRRSGGQPGELERGPWLEIVGVVPDFTVQSDFDPPNAKVYRAATVADMPGELSLVLRVRGGTTPATLAARVRSVAAAVDPTLRLEDVRTAAEMQRQAQQGLQAIALGVVAVILSVLLLSAAGVYAMMSFTVARRRREIGIRAALGADPRRVLAGVFARAGAQLGAGVAAGLLLAAAFEWGSGGALGSRALIMLPAVCALMVAVGLLAALGPARRSLNIQPTEALRAE